MKKETQLVLLKKKLWCCSSITTPEGSRVNTITANTPEQENCHMRKNYISMYDILRQKYNKCLFSLTEVLYVDFKPHWNPFTLETKVSSLSLTHESWKQLQNILDQLKTNIKKGPHFNSVMNDRVSLCGTQQSDSSDRNWVTTVHCDFQSVVALSSEKD